MSKWVNEIISDIKSNPKHWKRKGLTGICNINEDIFITGFYNGCLLSVCDVYIKGIQILTGLSWIDRYRLERAYYWWNKNADLDMILNTENDN